jgi:hypothetical protein
MEQQKGDVRVDVSSIVAVSSNQVSTTLGNEAVILGADAGQYFGLNEVGARIWELVQQPVRVSAICEAVCAEYEVAPDECERDVVALLNELSRNGLLDVQREPAGS